MEETTKSAFMALVGRPNTGKSSLLNALIGEKIAIVTHKPQTTRTNIVGILTKEDYQIVFTDTPGIHKPATVLGEEMVNSATNAMSECDIALMVAECRKPGDIEEKIIENLRKNKIKTILVLNKIDRIEKPAILPVIEAFSKIYDFESIIPVSALKNIGIDMLLETMKKYLIEGPFYYPVEMKTDTPTPTFVCEIVREKMLKQLNEEIPHGVALEPLTFSENKNLLKCDVNIYCERESHKKIIIGKNGETLKRIGTYAREELEKKYNKKVFIQLWVKTNADWRNNIHKIKSFNI